MGREVKHGRARPRPIVLVTSISLVGIAFLITGITLLIKRNSISCEATRRQNEKQQQERIERCSSSEEAKRSGLEVFLQRVQNKTFELHPFLIAIKPKVSAKEIRSKYRAYDPSPSNLQHVTDSAKMLFQELNEKEINAKKLKSRERKSLAQLRHFLKHVFGTPYDGNYYLGDFLLGPNVFCWQPICRVGDSMKRSLRFFKPSNGNDLETLIEKLVEVNETFRTYIGNLRYGVKAGMVRSVEECQAGLDAIRRSYFNISFHGPKGVFNESYMQDILISGFLSNLEDNVDQLNDWKKRHDGKTPSQSLEHSVLEHVGRPIHALLRYLEEDHLAHCVPSNVSSGFSFLPVRYVYVNGTPNVTHRTTKVLPTGEPLNGSSAFIELLSFFTTTNSSPDEVQKLGYKMLHELYPQAMEVARQVTDENDNKTARERFVRILNNSDMFFNNMSFPPQESTKMAFKLCSSVDNARRYCPNRWHAIQQWFKETREVMSMLDPKTTQMFYFTGMKQTTPNCPIELVPNFNPSAGVASYRNSDAVCSKNAKYFIPFFLERPGPRYMQWSVNAHEARPGHHTQVQGVTEHFQDSCGGLFGWLSTVTSYTAFTEGWALYAENPLVAYDTNTYTGKPLYKYGMLKSQLWRALRMIVDTGLHYKHLTRQQALAMFKKYLWDDSDVIRKEITRYQSVPGQATAYMIGQLHIIKLRKYAEKKLGDGFNLKEFHLQVLRHGSSPMNLLEESIIEYVDCILEKNKPGCDQVLNPTTYGQDDTNNSDETGSKSLLERELYF